MTDYDESPLGRITNVSWPTAQIKVLSVSQNIVTFGPADFADPPPATQYQKVLTGVDSGVARDFSNVPFDDAISVSTSGYPACVRTFNNAYDQDGNAVTTTPGIGYNVRSIGLAQIMASDSTSAGPDPPALCQSNNDRPTLPGYISGELVSATDPET